MLNYDHWIWEGDKLNATLIASQLVDEKQVASLVDEFRHSGFAQSGITGYCDFLISKGVLTYWQCAKLRNGQYKGLFIGEYVILDYLASNTSSLYVAKHGRTGEIVALVFDPPSPNYRDVRPIPPCFGKQSS